MARQRPAKILNPQVEALRPYLEGVAKKLAHDLFGPQGPAWGTSLTELEDIALQARAILTEKLLTIGLEQQAATPAAARPTETQTCPDCQRPFGEPHEAEPRDLETRAGPVAWSEPKEYCTRCRRAFFPSEQESGHRSHQLQPRPASQDHLCGHPESLVPAGRRGSA